jgi:hypothetical protein
MGLQASYDFQGPHIAVKIKVLWDVNKYISKLIAMLILRILLQKPISKLRVSVRHNGDPNSNIIIVTYSPFNETVYEYQALNIIFFFLPLASLVESSLQYWST